MRSFAAPFSFLLIYFSLVSSSAPGQLKLAPSQPELALQTGHSSRIASLDFSPDGRLLASAGNDRRILLWEVSTGRVVQRLEGRFDAVAQLKFSRDGKRLGVGTDSRIVGKISDPTISIWDVENGKELTVVKGAFGDFAFTPEGKVISGSTEGLLKLWDPENGLKLADLGAIGKLSSLHVEVSPDGRWLVCIGKSGAIEIRRLPDGVVLHSLTNENMGETFALSPGWNAVGLVTPGPKTRDTGNPELDTKVSI